MMYIIASILLLRAGKMTPTGSSRHLKLNRGGYLKLNRGGYIQLNR